MKQAWQAPTAQTRVTIDAELLLRELRGNERQFNAMIVWRDVREVGVCLLMLPVWLYLGIKLSLPWTWYLAVPGMAWIAGYLVADRMRQKRRRHEPAEPLRERVETSLAQVEHQIWLLRNVLWWYLLPIALPFLAFSGHVAWQERSGGWWTALGASGVVAIGLIVFAGIFWLNQCAVRCTLEPRRRELEALSVSLKDETRETRRS
jgi:hypothetical protein